MARLGFEMDRGLIALGGGLRVVVSAMAAAGDDAFFADAIGRYAGRRIRLPEKFAPVAEFLGFHRESVFLE